MESMDEKILKERAAFEEYEKLRYAEETIEEEKKQSIFDGPVNIHKVPVIFSERRLLEDRISIWMPEDFEEMTEEEIAAVYLLGNKPQLVLGNTYLNLSVGFNHTQHKVPSEFIGDFAKMARLMLEKSGPKVTVYAEKKKKAGKHDLSYLELTSHTLSGVIYNLIFFSLLEERVLIGFMNFNWKHANRFKPIVHEMLDSFCLIEDEEEIV